MKKISRKATTAVAGVLLVSFVFGTAALATTVVQPTVSLNARFTDHYPARNDDGIIASGVYNNVSPRCKGPGGRPVFLTATRRAFSLQASTTTNSDGSYSKLMGPARDGTYTVNVRVPGSVSGGYGKNTVCDDAENQTSVRVQ